MESVNRGNIMNFFRRDDLSDFSDEDKYEVALTCLSFSNDLYEGLLKLIKEYEEDQEQ